jgi:hypothetical protein
MAIYIYKIDFQAPEQEEEDKEIDENNQEDDPLYDQEMDDADAKWVQDYMRKCFYIYPLYTISDI